MGSRGGGGWLLMTLMTLVLWGGLIAVAVWAFRSFGRPAVPTGRRGRRLTPWPSSRSASPGARSTRRNSSAGATSCAARVRREGGSDARLRHEPQGPAGPAAPHRGPGPGGAADGGGGPVLPGHHPPAEIRLRGGQD